MGSAEGSRLGAGDETPARRESPGPNPALTALHAGSSAGPGTTRNRARHNTPRSTPGSRHFPSAAAPSPPGGRGR